MSEQIWILDPVSGTLTVQGLDDGEAPALAGDLLPAARSLTCARPLHSTPLPVPPEGRGPTLRLAGIEHGSVVNGPGRRSIVRLQGCNLRCKGCAVPETHDPAGGQTLPILTVAELLLDPAGAPRDGISVLGGEPMQQVDGLVNLLQILRARGQHIVLYTGYVLETLLRRPEPAVREALGLVDLLIDGPFLERLASGAGEWRGSRNQRLIPRVSLGGYLVATPR